MVRRSAANAFLAAIGVWSAALSLSADAGQVVLKDGRVIEGKMAPLASVAATPRAPRPDGAPEPQSIVMIDDNLRRYFVPRRRVESYRESDTGEIQEKFTLRRKVARDGKRVANVDSIIAIGDFDEFGHRMFSMHGAHGRLDVIQSITEITPTWCKVEGQDFVWDQRIATSSIKRETLDKILSKLINPKSVEDRLKIARLYVQSERYSDAKRELEGIVAEFPEVAEQVTQRIKTLTQLAARRMLTEVKVRKEAGQNLLVQDLLTKFPTENVSGEILQTIREMLLEYQTQRESGERALAQIDEHMAELGESQLAERLKPLVEEIRSELGYSTLDRLAPALRFEADEKLLPAEKLALALSGWLLGSNGATTNLPDTLSLFEMRDQVRQYFKESIKLNREDIYRSIRNHEGATPELISKLILYMKPPFDTTAESQVGPGLYKLSVRGLKDEADMAYFVQLPPEYDPHRYYPAIVTLHGGVTTAEQQIDWWAGSLTSDGERLGQASRYGYIVIAPVWTAPQQREYDYTAVAHAAVLNSLRDACRRFSIDSDRVFLSGHAIGGDAAWDIGLSHPDLWAGVMPIVATADRYCKFYWPNAEYVPFYIVEGELDGDTMIKNSADLDRYFVGGFNVTVAEFLGRGHEHFSDEILRLFDWMQRYRRDFYPKQFLCKTMRTWDNYFWWVEVGQFPDKVVVEPSEWPPRRGTQAMAVEGSVKANNNIYVRTGANEVSIWLSPELIDFGQKSQIFVNGAQVNRDSPFIAGDLTVMLEDVRTRGDRQHPFWAKVESRTGRSTLVGSR